MKRILMVGSVACGKTTLCQRINGLDRVYRKTQSLEVINTTVDTPGEYLERRSMMRNLMTVAVDVDCVLFLMDPTQERFMFSPGHAFSFPVPVAGVVTKRDLVSEKEAAAAEELLRLAGADPVFRVSAETGEGIDHLMDFLR